MITAVQSNPIRPSQRPHCYICATEKNLTDDHVPPKGFFPPDDRKNLITAPLCENCHMPLKNTDEAMRVWIAAGAAGTSGVGAWIWKHKVLGSTFKRSPKLRENIKKYLQEMVIKTEDGLLTPVDVLKMPQGRVIPFIRRLTKGLLIISIPNTIISRIHSASSIVCRQRRMLNA